MDRAPATSGGDMIVVQVIVEKRQAVLDTQEINNISIGTQECSVGCERKSMSVWR